MAKKNTEALNCWEFKQCGRGPGGANATASPACPVTTAENLDLLHGGKNAGRACWFVLGTMCDGMTQASYASKYKSCIYCDFYKKVREEEFTSSPIHIHLTADNTKKR